MHAVADSLPPLKVLYIAGSGRSGSTVLERMLGQISGFTAVGELKHLADRGLAQNQLCGCGQPFRECVFWRNVLMRAFGSLPDPQDWAQLSRQVDRLRHLPRLMLGPAQDPYGRRLHIFADRLHRLYRSIQIEAGATVIVDASKDVSTLYLLSRVEGVALYCLHLVRDSRAVAYSWQRQRRRPEITDRIVYMQRHSPWRSTGEWMYRNLLIELAPRLLPVQRQMRLRYEDMVADPLPHLRKISVMLDEPVGELNFIDGHTVHLDVINHTVSGNPMRFQQGPLTLKLDAAWQTQMALSSRALVTALSWPLLLAYGYWP